MLELSFVKRLLVFAFISILIPHLAIASQITFSGRVVDQAGGAVAGATIAAVPEPPGSPLTTVSDARGEFRLALEPRVYRLTIAAGGFAELGEQLIASMTPGRERVFTLQVAGISEVVRVDADARSRVAAVSSATRTATPLRDVPQSISVVTAALIADQRLHSMADIVRYMPGVGMAQGEGNRDTPIVRGNSSTGDFYVDGVRDDAQYFRDTYNVDRIEALKGPNAMIFGRGGGGGVINRVTRQADWAPVRRFEAQFGSYDNRRFSADVGLVAHPAVAARVTGLYENSDSYRAGVNLEREGINPTIAVALGPNLTVRASYEFFRDRRVADRGVPSLNGRPVDTDAGTFFGDPAQSSSAADVNMTSTTIEYNAGRGISVRSRTNFAAYDKHYQNIFPGSVSGGTVSISGYDNRTDRQNLFNQTDLIVTRRTGRIGHVVATGIEAGRQVTDNFRRTAFFRTLGANVTTAFAPVSAPTISLPVEFRQNASDADNSGTATIAAVYAQDQIALSDHVQAVVGLRFDRFHVAFRNNRTGATFTSRDGLLSPRAGLIYKPIAPVSVYASYSLAYLPRAGDQLSSLSLTTQALDPEQFRNYEVGAKWDVRALALTLAAYRLDRGNVAVADPLDPTRSILVDAQRSTGVEAGLDGRIAPRWTIAGGYAFQRGEITRSISATAQAGAVLAQVPRHSLALWNRVELSDRFGAGMGLIYRGDIFAATDNLVTLPAYTRVDGALFWNATAKLRAQINVENLLDARYFVSAHSNSNILPGSPRAIKLAVTTRF